MEGTAYCTPHADNGRDHFRGLFSDNGRPQGGILATTVTPSSEGEGRNTRIGCLRPHVSISRAFYGSISTGTETPERYVRGHQNRGRTREGEPEASPSQARPGRGVVCTVLTLYQQIQGQ